MKANNTERAGTMPRGTVVRFEDKIYMLENKPRKPLLIGHHNIHGIEIDRSTELEVVKYPMQLAMDYVNEH